MILKTDDDWADEIVRDVAEQYPDAIFEVS